jgi:hypothetical protein
MTKSNPCFGFNAGVLFHALSGLEWFSFPPGWLYRIGMGIIMA